MPVVAVIGGLASAAAGVTAFGAAMGTFQTVMAGLKIVGGVASALGGLTGNKKLMKVGMIASLGSSAMGGLEALTSTSSTNLDMLSGTAAGEKVMSTGLGAEAAGSGLGVQVGNVGQGGDALWAVGDYAPQSLQGLGSSGAAGAAGAAGDSGGMLSRINAAAEGAGPAQISAAGPAVSPPAGSSFTGGVQIAPPPTTTGVWDTVTGGVKGFGDMMSKNPEFGKIGMGMLSGMAQQKAEDARIRGTREEEERRRLRMQDSIKNQRYA